MSSADQPPLRIALAMVPPLLADSLRKLLEDDAEVTVILDDTDERFDVALTCPGAPKVDASLVIRLDDDPRARGGGWVRLHGDDYRLKDLRTVLAYVRAASTTRGRH